VKTKAYLINPEKMLATVEITMTISEFEHYLAQTKDASAWPSWKVRNAILDIIHKAKKEFLQIEETP